MSGRCRNSILPFEHPFDFSNRINDKCDLARPGKKVLLDEQISIGKEDAEVGVRMIPAHDSLVLKLRVHFLVDVRPRFVGEGDLGEFLRRAIATNVVSHRDERPVGIASQTADKYAADFETYVL